MLLGLRNGMATKQGADYWGLCFTAEEADATIQMVKVGGSAPSVSLEYSTDGKNWQSFEVGTTTITLSKVGNKAWIRAGAGGNTNFGSLAFASQYNKFVLSKSIAASGNIMSLLDGAAQDNKIISKKWCFNSLFINCTSLTTAPELPATALAQSCYASMFKGCTGLTTAPELPATALADTCYDMMFMGCTRLKEAPTLPATTLPYACYGQMFRNCTSLSSSPTLPALVISGRSYGQMFQGCTSLTTAPVLSATTLLSVSQDNHCLQMFQGCTSLTTAPALLATTLVKYCYANMFQGCTSLTSAPDLPATTLVNYCYSNMFRGDTKLNSLRVGLSAFNNTNSTINWLLGTSATGTFYCPTTLGTNETITRGTNNCPTGWTVINTDA